METILGIDLGTTNSEVAVIRRGRVDGPFGRTLTDDPSS
jgi:molecular chaperone DnaK (HSP70)